MAMNARRLFGWVNLLVAAAVAAAIWGAVAILGTLPELRLLWDWSPQARFTVEPATRQLLAELREQDRKVEFHTIFIPWNAGQARTEDERRNIAIQQRLQALTRDLLRQYDFLGGDAVSVTHHDPRFDVDAIKEVVTTLSERRYDSVIVKVGSRAKVLSLQSDLAVFEDALDQNPEGGPRRTSQVRMLRDYKGEEALSTALKRLLVEGTPKLYLLAGLGGATLIDPVRSSFSHLLAALKDDGFELSVWNLREHGRLPEDADVLALLDPHAEIPPDAADQLFEHTRRGGRLFLNVRYHHQPASWNRPLEHLGRRFGFTLGTDLVCHLIRDPRDPNQMRSGTAMVQNLVAERLNPAHPITEPLSIAGKPPLFKAGRDIRAHPDGAPQGVRPDPLAWTGPLAWLEERTLVRTPGADPEPDFVAPANRQLFGPRPIAMAIDVDPAEAGGPGGRVVVLAAAGLENDGFEYNGDFGLNVFNWLAERDALLSIRGKLYVSRRLELTPQQVDRMWWLLVAGLPGVLLAFGLVVFWRRGRA